jgi:hypothetical protein
MAITDKDGGIMTKNKNETIVAIAEKTVKELPKNGKRPPIYGIQRLIFMESFM